jgi:phage/plasmid-like protein (TIGR03299 family)
MRSLLDEIVDSHHSGPVILSEQHDTGRINWVGGVTDPGEMIGCGRYQELRRLTGEGDAEYQERLTLLLPTLPREHREKIEAAMRTAANARAGLDTTGGRVALMVAGQHAWHKLGVNVRDAVSSADALNLAGLGWQVKKQPHAYKHPVTGEWLESKLSFSVVRQDSGAELGAVGSRYKPFQNSDGFAMLDGVLGSFGAKYEAAGSLYGGKRVFMLVKLPEQAFSVGHRDQVDAYALFTNPHDGSGVAECFATSERVVCANTLRVARAGKKGGLKIRHTGDLKQRVADARQALNLTVQGFTEFKEQAEVLGRTPMPNITHYCNDVLDAVLDVTLADMKKGADVLAAMIEADAAERELARKSIAAKIERRGEILQDMLERYESERCGLNGQRGTAWAAVNAVTESADHGKLGGKFVGSENAKASRRFESILTGEADEAKQVAYDRALALAN